jgi:glycine/D-amino acid oxidase-like deaminating enzyme
LRVGLNYGGSYAATKPDGLIWAGTTEEDAGFDENATSAARDSIMEDLIKMAPGLWRAELVRQTACLRPVTPDGMPIVAKLPGWENVFVATGAGRKGILWSTGMSHILADLVTQGSTEVSGAEFLGLERFQ